MDAAAGCLMGDESGCWAVAEGALSRRHLVDESRRVSEDTIPGGTTVILGGLGRVGSAIARALAARDARKIVLVARGEATDLLDDLRSLGSDVTLVCGDAADPALLRRVLAEESTPVGLVVHAAGHVADEPIARLSAEGLASVLDAKLGVAEAIDSVLEPSVPLLITSGLPGTLGVAGQAAWSAAAAAVDAVAMRREGPRPDRLPWGASVGPQLRMTFCGASGSRHGPSTQLSKPCCPLSLVRKPTRSGRN